MRGFGIMPQGVSQPSHVTQNEAFPGAAGDRAVYGVDAVLVQTGGRGDAAQDVLQEAGEVLLTALQAVALHVIGCAVSAG